MEVTFSFYFTRQSKTNTIIAFFIEILKEIAVILPLAMLDA